MIYFEEFTFLSMSLLQKILSFTIFLILLGGFYWIYLGLRPADRSPTSTLSLTENLTLEDPATLGKIERIRGKVNGSGTTGKIDTTPGSPVTTGMLLTTGPISEIEIVWSDTSLLRIGENSSVQILGKDSIRVDTGVVWSRTVRNTQIDPPFSVHTSRVVAAIRGTGMEVRTDEKATRVRLIDSSVLSGAGEIVLSGSGISQTFLLNAGDSLEVGSGALKPPIIEKFDLETLMSQEALVAEYLKRDIIHLDNTLINLRSSTVSTDIEARERIEREIDTALPIKDEVKSLFLSKAISEEATNLFRTNISEGVYTPEERRYRLIELMRNDRVLGEFQESLINKRNTDVSETEKESHQQSINTLTRSIEEFDVEWKKRYDAGEIERKERILQGENTLPTPDSETPLEQIVNPVERDTPIQTESTEAPPSKPISLPPKTPESTIQPPIIPPKVSSSAIPKSNTVPRTIAPLPIPSLGVSGSASPR